MLTDARVPVRLSLMALSAQSCLTYTYRHSLSPESGQARQHPLMHQIGTNSDCVALGIAADSALLAHCFFHFRARSPKIRRVVLHSFLVRPHLFKRGLSGLLALHWLKYLLDPGVEELSIESECGALLGRTRLLAELCPELARGKPLVRVGAALSDLKAALEREEPLWVDQVLSRMITNPEFAAPLARKGCLIGLASPDESCFQMLLGMRWPAHATVQPIRLQAGVQPENPAQLDLLLLHQPQHEFARPFIARVRADQPGLPLGIVGDAPNQALAGAVFNVSLSGLAAGLHEFLEAYEPARATISGRRLHGNLLRLPEPGPIGMFRGRHAGQRLFIAASGPSLAEVDGADLEGQIVLSVNDAILKFPYARYGAVMDSRKLNELHRELHRADAVFTLENNSYGVGVKNLGTEGFSANAEEGVYSGYTTTYFALQIALFMGFTEIFMLGLDLAAGPDKSHFFGLRPLQDRDRPEVYLQMQRSFERAVPLIADLGVKIYNCSPVSKLKAFPFRPLEEVLNPALTAARGRSDAERIPQRRV